MDIQVHEAYRSPNKINLKKSSPRHIVAKQSKIKDKEIISRAARKKQKFETYKGTP